MAVRKNGKISDKKDAKKSDSKKEQVKKVTLFERIAGEITKFTGSSPAFLIALALVIAWAITGPVFNYSETWQLVINTGTTIITFLMVFIIQHSQNKDTLALQLKLDELIIAMGGASNELVDAENLCEEDLQELRAHYAKISERMQMRKKEKLNNGKMKNSK